MKTNENEVLEENMNVRFLMITMLLVFSTVLLTAQTPDFIGGLGNSVATTDNFLSPFVNPAALGYGNAGGLGVMRLCEEMELQDHYWFIANMEGLGYAYEKNVNQSIHTLSTGSETFTAFKLPNLYTGVAYQWTNDKTNEGNFKTGLMYRPLNSTSLGITLDNPHKTSPAYRFGLGIRPLQYIWKSKAHGLELNADLQYQKAEGDYTMLKPTMGFSSQLANGVLLKANYNMETESAMFGVSFASFNSLFGGEQHTAEPDNSKVSGKTSYGLRYGFISDKAYLPFLGFNQKSWYTLPVKSNVVTYKAPSFEMGPFKIFDDKQTSVEELISQIRKAKADPNVTGMLFMNKNFAASMALKQEIIAEIKDFKAAGKPVVFYYDNMSNGDYVFAAAVADKIYLNPQGSIDLKGIAANSPYVKGALNALGIDVYNFRSHPTKTAGNMFSETEMIPEERAMYERILGDLYNQMCEMISTGRGDKLVKDVKATIDAGPYYMAEDALKAGLVDALVYEAEFKDTLKKEYKYTKKTKELTEYQDYNWSHPKKDKIAVIYAQGNIVMGKGAAGKKIAHQTTIDLIRKARKNKEYKGIILRIDSGGGSAQASDIIWKEIELAKSENKKPIVVTMTGVAGSGGYYIACNADHIIADPATITGSIGVIGITFTADRLFKKLHVNWDSVKKGEHSDFGSMNRQWTQDEKAIFTDLIERSYHSFVGKVAKGRNMDYDAIDKIAQGQIWTGVEGKAIGIVDELGGMREAVAKMKQLAKIKGDVELVNASKSEGTEITLSLDTMMSALPISDALYEVNDYLKPYEQWMQYKSEKLLYASPFNLDEIAQK